MCIRTRTQGKTDYNFNSFLFPLFPPFLSSFFLICSCVCVCVRACVWACVRACVRVWGFWYCFMFLLLLLFGGALLFLFCLVWFYFGQATTPNSIVKWSKMQNKTYTTKQYNNEERRGLRHCANASLSCLHLHRGQRGLSQCLVLRPISPCHPDSN